MGDLISKSALKADLLSRNFYPVFVKHAIETAPIVDAVEVVRCKDCKNLYDEPDDYCCIRHVGLVKITPDSFCSYGERRADERT